MHYYNLEQNIIKHLLMAGACGSHTWAPGCDSQHAQNILKRLSSQWSHSVYTTLRKIHLCIHQGYLYHDKHLLQKMFAYNFVKYHLIACLSSLGFYEYFYNCGVLVFSVEATLDRCLLWWYTDNFNQQEGDS